MNGKLNRPGSRTAAPSLAKRPVIVAAIAILLAGVAATGTWLTLAPQTAAPRAAGPAEAKRVVAEEPSPAAAPTASIVLQAAPAPPEPTSTDFTGSGSVPPAPTPVSTPVPTPAAEPPKPTDWAATPIDELRARANAEEIAAMEELARRLVQGVGVTKDQQAGAGWLLRAAQRGSPQSAFNVAVMYERGFVVERDSTRAIEWYRKAVDANLPMAKHNLALLLRDGKGAPRDGKEAIELLRSAARQGMAASMFTLGDIYERGDAAPKDAATAMAWFAIAAEFERQTNRDTETPLAKTATQRTQTLQRILTPAELERAQQVGRSEFKLIVEALSPPKPPPVETVETPAQSPPDVDPLGWPKAAADQIRVIQQALFDLRLLRDKPDGAMGPMTRTAIRAFQRSITMRETGEPTREVYAALRDALTSRDVVTNSPLPPPTRIEPAQTAPPKAEAKIETPAVELPRVDLPKTEGPKVGTRRVEAAKVEPPKQDPATTDAVEADPPKAAPKPEPAPTVVDFGRPEPPPPPTSVEIARATPAEAAKDGPAKPAPDAWPAAPAEQVRAIQRLLRDLNFSPGVPDGLIGPETRTAIRDYERTAGLPLTGEPSKALFESLTELRLRTAPKAD